MMSETPPPNYDDLTFRVNPRILRLLGEQLIRDASVAIFELVKNAYDADATQCSIVLENIDEPHRACITIQDNGSGMDEEILRNAWMVIGTSFREEQRTAFKRSPIFNRFPLGEKGLGRLSVHKLGQSIRLITRKRGGIEFLLEFDWNILENLEDFSLSTIKLQTRTPQTFPGTNHGTKIEVASLRENWSRKDIRRLHRTVNSLCSPYKGPTDFEVNLSVPEHSDWLKGLLTAQDVADYAHYHITGSFEGSSAHFQYDFIPPKGLVNQIGPRTIKVENLRLIRKGNKEDGEPRNVTINLSDYNIGKVDFDFRLFDRAAAVLNLTTDDSNGLKDFLNHNGGIRIYRDGVRVYDFGEPGNDWLNLDMRRVNSPVAKVSNNQILGILRLDATTSSDLKEKSNREGFIENQSYETFRQAIFSLLKDIEAE